MVFDPGSPLEAIRLQFPHARVDFDDGSVPARAAEAAAKADAVILFVDQWMTESADAPSLNLPGGQDQSCRGCHPRQSPHRGRARDGRPGAHALARTDRRCSRSLVPGAEGRRGDRRNPLRRRQPFRTPAGHLPGQRRSVAPPENPGRSRTARRSDPSGGADTTARCSPLCTMKAQRSAINGSSSGASSHCFRSASGFPTRTFALSELAVNVSGHTVTASATVRNSGDRAGTATPQFYLTGPNGANILLRLVGWDRVDLKPGEQRQVAVSIDPRLLATFDEGARRWRIRAGAYELRAGFELAAPRARPRPSSFSRRACRPEEIRLFRSRRDDPSAAPRRSLRPI